MAQTLEQSRLITHAMDPLIVVFDQDAREPVAVEVYSREWLRHFLSSTLPTTFTTAASRVASVCQNFMKSGASR